MDTELLKVLGKIAGIGGLSLGVFLVITKNLVAKNIFPMLSNKNAYNLLRLIVILTWGVAVFGLLIWALSYYMESKTDKKESSSDVKNYTNALDNNYGTIRGNINYGTIYGDSNYTENVIVHQINRR